MENLLHIFRNRLLDLSSANRSVFLPKVYKGKFSDVKTWDFLSEVSALSLIKSMAAGRNALKIADVKHVRPDDLEALQEEARRLIRTAQLIREETGTADFYVGWPFVEGVMKNGMPLRAPLIFFPYKLRQSGREIFLEKQEGAAPFWNRSLFLSLNQFESYAFASQWLETPVPVWEDFPDRDFRLGLLEELKAQGWQVSFDREFLSDNLVHLLPQSKSDLQERYPPGHYKLRPMAVMGLFPQSASYIHSDYEQLLTQPEAQNTEQLLASHYTFPSGGLTSRTLADFIPLPVDGAQENIIGEVAAGKSLVVQGPPGSGKTQLICNLIAQFIGKGKKVLVICQKKAALDVIEERLRSIDLERFAALVHDAADDRKKVYDQLVAQILSSEEYKKQNIHPDTIVLEKEFTRIQSSVARLSDFFTRYKQALYDTQLGGESIHRLYLLSDRSFPVTDLSLEFHQIPANELEQRSHDFSQFIFYYRAIAKDFDVLKGVLPRALSIDDKEVLQRLLSEVEDQQAQLRRWNEQEPWMGSVDLSFAQDWLLRVRTWMNETLVYRYQLSPAQVESFNPSVITGWKQTVKQHFLLLNKLISLPSPEKRALWKPKTFRAVKSGFNFLLFRISVGWGSSGLLQWMRSNKIPVDKEGVLFTNQVFTAMEELEALQRHWERFPFLEVAHGLTERLFQQHLKTFERVHLELQQAEEIPVLHALWRSTPSFRERLESMLDLVRDRQQRLSPYFSYWQPQAVGRLFEDQTYLERWRELIRYRFEQWLGYEQLQQHLPPVLIASFQKVLLSHPEAEEQTLVEAWKQSLYKAWIEEKERVFPILKTVSTPEWDMKEKELNVLVDRRYTISLEFLKIKLREWVYAGIQYNRLNRQVTYRDLLHQLTKKRSLWPLRKLMTQHGEEILNLIPCWLVSPETASTVFPLKANFDLVIFDEASQCFVEKAFPSLFRAKQTVVIGDDRQLRPSDLYRVRYKADEEEDHPDTEVESLLDFAARYFPPAMLTGHYRSRSEQLIRFSNQHFYNNRLRVVPDVTFQKEQALQYIRVEGLWQANTNREEAEKVVEVVRELQASQPKKSIGIITFNYPQAFLINDLLEKSGLVLPPDLLIKNIENVQGDERDMIIFSVAYARNREGKLVTQFGSLSQDGGENRLNVAVSRAREKVIVVASIWPQELQVEHHKNKGPELLRQYLQFVYDSGTFTDDTPAMSSMHSPQPALSAKLKASFGDRLEPSYFADLHDREEEARLIFTDDHRYFFAPSAVDWHAYMPKLLTTKGWRPHYFYARNHWFDGNRFRDQLTGRE